MNYQKTMQEIEQWFNHLKSQSGMKKAILGISGGKDSTVAAMLLVKFLGKENVIGVLMPNGSQKDIDDSYTVVKTLDIPYLNVNINKAYNGLLEGVKANGITLTEEALINVPPRLRMTTLYLLGQSLGARVCGTGNRSERFVGYFTKWGDGACDFNPLGMMTSIQVVELGLELAKEFNIDPSLITKTPADGLTEYTDEEKLGVSYQAIHDYLTSDSKEMNTFDNHTFSTITAKHKYAKHKLEPIPIFPFRK